MRIIAYYPTWSIHGRNYFFKNLPAESLTDVTLAFALPRIDGSLNLDEMGHLNLEELREIGGEGLRIGVAIGGWGTSEEFSAATESESARNHLIESSLDMVGRLNLNYLEIDWEYPANAHQTNNLKLLLEGLRRRLPASVQLSICVPCFQGDFKIKDLHQLVDFVVLMGYDMAGSWSAQSGHHSALLPNIQNHVEYLAQIEGIPVGKIVLGCPLYARTFANCLAANRPFSGPGLGSFGEQGSMDYKDVIKYCREIMYDPDQVSHYATFENNFMTFEGPTSLQVKCNWIKNNGLSGIAFWQAAGDGNDSDSLIKQAANFLK